MSLANSAVPLTTGFISEFFIISSIFNMNPFIALLTTSSIILVPIFMLNLLHRISYGQWSRYMPIITSDITIKEFHFFVPLVFFTLFYGILPMYLLDDFL
jgi:NADH-quinone oxidoreductase subunit M